MLRLRLTGFALLLSAGLAHAGIENAGTTAGNFLSVGTGAGVLSMGGATLGAGRDLNAAAWNPAALGFLSSSQYALQHAALAMDVSQDWIAASGRMGHGATHWSASALYQNDGSFDGRDALGVSTGAFSVSNLAVGLALARPFTPDVTAGVRFNYLSESLGSASGSGYGMDLGLQARHGAFGFGAAARNIGGSMKYDSGSYDLPGVVGAGLSWTDERRGVRLAMDANFPSAYYNDVRMGGEWTWQQRVALRAGYRLELGGGANEPLGGPSFGFGTGVNGFWFDYAFLAGGSDAQGAHRFGLTFHPAFFQHGDAKTSADGSANTTSSQSGPVAAAKTDTPAKSDAPAPARQDAPVAPKAAAPVAAQAEAPASAKPEQKAAKIEVPAEGTNASVAPRSSAPTAAALPTSKPVRVPKLATPKSDDVVTIAAPAPAAQKPSVAAPVATAPAVTAPAAKATEQKADAPAVTAAPPVAQVAATPAPAVVVVKPAPKTEARPAQVTVEKGETLESIAKRWGTSGAAIMMENNLVSTTVKPGQKLKLPKR